VNHSEDIDSLATDAVGYDVGCPGDHELAGVRQPPGTPLERKIREVACTTDDFRGDARRRLRAVFGDVVIDG